MSGRTARTGALLALVLGLLVAVLAPVAHAAGLSLTLSPTHGPAGTTVQATAHNFGGCDYSRLIWLSSGELITSGYPAGQDPLTASFTVPPDAAAGPLTVRATCEYTVSSDSPTPLPNSHADATFTVEATTPPPGPTPVPNPNQTTPHPTTPKPTTTKPEPLSPTPAPTTAVAPALQLDPVGGPPGTTVRASGTGLDCATGLLFDDTQVADLSPDGDGAFAADFQVPQGATDGRHTVRAECADDSSVSATAGFAVQSAVVPGPGDGGGSQPVAVVVGSATGGALLLALFGVLLLRPRRVRWARDHVRVRTRAEGPGRVSLAETGDGREPDGGRMRLQARPDAGTRRIEEEEP